MRGLTFELTGTLWCDGIWPRMKWRGKWRHAAMCPVERMVRRHRLHGRDARMALLSNCSLFGSCCFHQVAAPTVGIAAEICAKLADVHCFSCGALTISFMCGVHMAQLPDKFSLNLLKRTRRPSHGRFAHRHAASNSDTACPKVFA